MTDYLHSDRKTITDFSESNITSLYNEGYVFTRRGKGVMDQTRSIRIDLYTFTLSSENRRILRKTEDIELSVEPLPFSEYSWKIGKQAKDFYDAKFGKGTMSANKIREMLTDETKSNFNTLFLYTDGHAVCYENANILHYSYPFYTLETQNKNQGMGMMLKATVWAKEHGKKYIYLGSAQRPSDTYKLQFAGLEWFDGKKWSSDIVSLKEVLV